MATLAGLAKRRRQGRPPGAADKQPALLKENHSANSLEVRLPLDEVAQIAARLYGQGASRGQIAKAMVDHICPVQEGRKNQREYRVRKARSTLAKWEMTQSFRDMVYDNAVVKLDMSTPAILAGVTKAAKKGKVDAARLALELAGRHSSKGEMGDTHVEIKIANIPRPG